MRVGIIGGGLQGIEATYLSNKAGWETVLIDKKSKVPAKGLCHQFLQLDVTEAKKLTPTFKDLDLIIPATENLHAILSLVHWSQSEITPLAFDLNAYRISSSKKISENIFQKLEIPIPQSWPQCGFPVIIKPIHGSGSKGVKVFLQSHANVKELKHLSNEQWIQQEYIEGPSYSLEIAGSPKNYKSYTITNLEFDGNFDCKRVTAPGHLPSVLEKQFKNIAKEIAEKIQLKGLMDVEVILHKNQLKVLEIDARLPSQTPTVVYWSTGINLCVELSNIFINDPSDSIIPGPSMSKIQKAVIYEHLKVTPGIIEICGERIISHADEMTQFVDFFGADEAISDYAPLKIQWIATLIIIAPTFPEAQSKRDRVIKNIQKHFHINFVKESTPNST